jgi:hypothetical protein
VLRFDTAQGGTAKVKLPFPKSIEGDKGEHRLEELLRACAPATFGCEGSDILDELYRKAGKLDRSQFSVDFHPHDYGIVDAIAQTRLPSLENLRIAGLNPNTEHWGVVAELYKLNVRPYHVY